MTPVSRATGFAVGPRRLIDLGPRKDLGPQNYRSALLAGREDRIPPAPRATGGPTPGAKLDGLVAVEKGTREADVAAPGEMGLGTDALGTRVLKLLKPPRE